MKLMVLGASGGVGSNLVKQAQARGHQVTAQTREAGRLKEAAGVDVVVGAPDDASFLERHVAGHDAVILAIGVSHSGPTTLFSGTTRAVIAAMETSGVRRLVAITGVGAGQTRGHGGWLYNRLVFPLFTRNRYADKDRQEAAIEQSNLDWTIVRPAPFTYRPGRGPRQVVTDVPHELQLRSITRAEVAAFILDCVERNEFIRQKPFIGHGRQAPR